MVVKQPGETVQVILVDIWIIEAEATYYLCLVLTFHGKCSAPPVLEVEKRGEAGFSLLGCPLV